MPFQIRYTLNRASVNLKPKQPLIDWLKGIDRAIGAEPIGIFDSLDENGDVFLIPDEDVIESREDAIKWVEKRWSDFFEFELGKWIIDDQLWPKNRTLKLFREWFDIEYHSMVWDLGNEPLATEDWLVE